MAAEPGTPMSAEADREAAPRRVEPWPWLVAGLLLSMIAGSLTFLAIAIRNPDPVVGGSVWEASPPVEERRR